MKKVLVLFIAGIILSSCIPTYQLRSDCDINTADLFKNLTSLLSEEGSTVENANTELGFLQASKKVTTNFSIPEGIYFWKFSFNKGSLKAYSYHRLSSGSEYYDNDKASRTYQKHYWTIRDYLGKVCKNVEIVEIKD